VTVDVAPDAERFSRRADVERLEDVIARVLDGGPHALGSPRDGAPPGALRVVVRAADLPRHSAEASGSGRLARADLPPARSQEARDAVRLKGQALLGERRLSLIEEHVSDLFEPRAASVAAWLDSIPWPDESEEAVL
jgi:hypothetical protein